MALKKYENSPDPKIILHYLRQRMRVDEEDHIFYEYHPHVERASYGVDPNMRPAYRIVSDFHSELPIFRHIAVYLEWDHRHHHWVLTDNGNGEFESVYNNLNIHVKHMDKYSKIFSKWLKPIRKAYHLDVNDLGDYFVVLNDLSELEVAFYHLVEFDIIITNTASYASFFINEIHRPKHFRY